MVESIGMEEEAARSHDGAWTPVAISVRNATKEFGRECEEDEPLMKDLNMTVREGTIYTLLGSSGCGKTTLLQCIIGLQHVDSGEIRVFGRNPGQQGLPGQMLGYMPQETSLYPTLTIMEMLQYFGMLYGMEKDKIEERTNFLVKFLQLPVDAGKPVSPQGRIIASLSGGEQRRTSFALSLLADPPLLILDEPTVGVDPLLREGIWNHLAELVRTKKTTVIITTHYMEESLMSDVVGFMRNGRLLLEQSPDSLLQAYGQTQITPVLLEICEKTDEGISVLPHNQRMEFDSRESMKITKNSSDSEKQDETTHAGHRICAMMQKNLLLMTRNYISLIFLICVPAFQAILFCIAVGDDPKFLPFGVVNHEVLSSEDNCTASTVLVGRTCTLNRFSCLFLAKIPNDTIVLKYFTSDEAAHNALVNGETWGYMRIPPEFTSNIMQRSMSMMGKISNPNQTMTYIEGSQIKMEVDASSKLITATYFKVFATSYNAFSKDMLSNCGMEPRVLDLPLEYLKPIYGEFGSAFRNFLAPCLVLGILFYFPMVSSSMQVIRDKKLGTFNRSLVAGARAWEWLTAYSVSESVIVISQTAVGFALLAALFQFEIKGSILLVFTLFLMMGLCGVSVGFLIGSVCREETNACLLSIAVFFPNFMLSGMFWPMEGLPQALRYVGYSLPCTLAGEAMRSMIIRGWDFFHPKVWPGFAVAGAWIAFFWLLAAFLQWFKTAPPLKFKK